MPGVEHFLPDHALTVAHLDDAFDGDDDLAEEFFEAFDFDPAFNGFLDRLFATALHLDDIPALVAGRFGRLNRDRGGRPWRGLFVIGRFLGWRNRFRFERLRVPGFFAGRCFRLDLRMLGCPVSGTWEPRRV